MIYISRFKILRMISILSMVSIGSFNCFAEEPNDRVYADIYYNQSKIDISPLNNNLSISYGARATNPRVLNAWMENITDVGFDFYVQLSDEMYLDYLSAPYWKRGEYNGMKSNIATNLGGNKFKTTVKFKDIGSGSDYVYFGVHPANTSTGYSYFACDLAVKVDTISPNLTTSANTTAWTNQNVTISATTTDNMNIIETINFYDQNNVKTSFDMHSEPKVLVIRGYDDAWTLHQGVNGFENVTSLPAAQVTSVTQVKAYDVVLYDGVYFGLDERMANILNQAFEEGVSIFSAFNDSPELLSIASSQGNAAGNYTFYEAGFDPGGEFYHRGRFSRFAYLLNGFSEDDSGYAMIQGTSDVFTIANVRHSDGSTTPGILFKTHERGNKWIHYQGYAMKPQVVKKVVDELMHGFSKRRQTYQKQFTVSQNGIYAVESVDFSGNITYKAIAVNNIDKIKPSFSITGNPTSYAQSASLTITAADSGGSGVKEIVMPDGSIVSGSTANFYTTTNGTYTFKVRDNAGNETSQSVSISKIDTTKPTASVSIDATTTTNKVNVYLSNIQDTYSGAKTIRISESSSFAGTPTTYTLNGETSKTVQYTLNTLSPEENNYKARNIYVKLIDNVGNYTIYTLSTTRKASSATIQFITPTSNQLYLGSEKVAIEWSINNQGVGISSLNLTIKNTSDNTIRTYNLDKGTTRFSVSLPDGYYEATLKVDNVGGVSTSKAITFRINKFKTSGNIRSVDIVPPTPVKKVSILTEADIPPGTNIEGLIYYKLDSQGNILTQPSIPFKISANSDNLNVYSLPSATTKLRVEYKLSSNSVNNTPLLDSVTVYAR